MSKQKKEDKVVYPVVEMKGNGRLIIPDNIVRQINYLHGQVGSVEWSGMLFYDVISGNPSKPENFVLEAKYIFPMDIGTAAYTEYEPDGDFVDLYTEFEEAMEWKTGHIHTHHTMKAYFSGTDMSELNDNVDKHNYYLSLIVNFAGQYDAKVAFLSDVHSSTKMNWIDDSGKKKHFKTEVVEKQMVTVDMDIYYEDNDQFFYKSFKNMKEKAAKVAKKKTSSTYVKGSKWDSVNQKWILPDTQSGLEDSEFKALPEGNKDNDADYDPKDLKNAHVEKLARNVVAVNADLKEQRSVYQIIHTLATSKHNDMEIYYNYLANNIENVIENFFDIELEADEMSVVLSEIKASFTRFIGIPLVKPVIDGISEVMDEFFVDFTKRAEEKNMEEQIQEQLLENEIELL